MVYSDLCITTDIQNIQKSLFQQNPSRSLSAMEFNLHETGCTSVIATKMNFSTQFSLVFYDTLPRKCRRRHSEMFWKAGFIEIKTTSENTCEDMQTKTSHFYQK